MLPSSVCIGYSTHNRAQLEAAAGEPVDYLAIGPIFATGSKEKPDPVVGVEELARLRRLTNKPLVAIGGITRANAAAVLAAGADAVAVISDLLAADVDARLQEWLRLIKQHSARG
jgi:thiamine-phosphate pyrophosphorylase